MIKCLILISTLVKQKPQSTVLCGFAEIRDLVGVWGLNPLRFIFRFLFGMAFV